MKVYKYHQLAEELLIKASSQFSKHGCNDLDDEEIEMIKTWSYQQKKHFIYNADQWNNGDMGLAPETLHEMPDWLLMSVIAFIIGKEARQQEELDLWGI